MKKKIEITLPPLKADKEERLRKMKQILTYDKNEGEGILSQVMVFTQMYGPISITALTNKIESYYQKEIDRSMISRATDKLVRLGLMFKGTSEEIMLLSEEEKKEVHKQIDRIHRNFLHKISVPFRNNFGKMNYVWVANGEGLDYMELCCKLNGFDYKEK